MPEKDGSSKYVKAQQDQRTCQGLWSSDLACMRLTHQRVSFWWVDTLNFNCHVLLLWYGHQQPLIFQKEGEAKFGEKLTRLAMEM
ncbi:hypothetical protein STEG23_028425 [Scotinomys teguina]